MNSKLKKRLISILNITVISVTVLVITAYFTIKIPFVQNYIISKIETKLSKDLSTKIKVGSVSFDYLSRLVLEDLIIEDQLQDTLIYVKEFKTRIQDYQISSKHINLSDISLIEPTIYIKEIDTNKFNYSFIEQKIQQNNGDNSNTNFEDLDYLLNNLNISNAQLQFKSLDKKVTISNFNLEIENFQLKNTQANLKLNKLNFKSNIGYQLYSLKTEITHQNNSIEVKDLYTDLNNSTIDIKKLIFKYKDYRNILSLENRFELIFGNNTSLQLSDLQIKSLTSKNRLNLKGRASGNLRQIRCKSLNIGYMGNELNSDITIINPSNIDKIKYSLKLNIEASHIKPIYNLIDKSTIPTWLDSLQNLNSSIKILGNKDSATAKIKVSSNLAQLKLETKTFSKNSLSKFTTYLNIENSEINNPNLIAKFSGNYKLEHNRQKINSVHSSTNFKNIKIQNNNYQNLLADINLINNKYYLNLKSLDKRANLDLKSTYQYTNNKHFIKLKADLKNFLYENGQTNQNLSFKLSSDFSIDHSYNFTGDVFFKDIAIKDDTIQHKVKELNIFTKNNKDFKNIFIESDLCDATINGKFNFNQLIGVYENIAQKYLPFDSLTFKKSDIEQNQFIKLKVNLKPYHNENILRDWIISEQTSLSAYIDSRSDHIEMILKTKELGYQNKRAENIEVRLLPVDSALELKIKSDYVNIENAYEYRNFVSSFTIKKGISNFFISANNLKNKISEFSGTLKKDNANYKLLLNDSRLYLKNMLWNLNSTQVKYYKKELLFDNFKIYSDKQELELNGSICRDSKANLNIGIRNFEIDINDDPIFLKSKLNGDISLYDVYRNPKFNLSLRLGNTEFNDGKFGNIYIRSFWDEELNKFTGRVINSNAKAKINLNFKISNNLDFTSKGRLDSIPVHIFSNFMDVIDIKGSTHGNVSLDGNLSRPLLNGEMIVNNASVKVDYTGVTYKVKENSAIKFRDFNFVFDNIPAYDSQGNAVYTNGTIEHHNFDKMDIKLSFKPNNAQVIDIKKEEKKFYYGTGYGTGEVVLKKDTNKLYLITNVKLLEGTEVNIPFSRSQISGNEIVKFKSNILTKENKEVIYDDWLDLDLNFEVDNNTKINAIINGKKDLNLYGIGNINIQLDDFGNPIFYGNYTTSGGKFTLSLLDIPIKEFTIMPYGKLNFSGSPSQTVADISAVYKINRVETKDLGIGINREIPVDCFLHLNGGVEASNVKFEIDIPESSADADLIKNKFNDLPPVLLNQQLFYLLMMRKFTPLIDNEQNAQSDDVDVTNSLFELLGNQLNDLLSRITNKFDIGLAYKKGDQITADQLQLALSYYISDKLKLKIESDVSINENETQQTANPNKNQILKEAELEYTPLDNSNLKIKAYHKVQDEFELNTEVDNNYKQGVGVSYEEDFNSFSELFSNYWHAIMGDDKEEESKYIVRDSSVFKSVKTLNIDSSKVNQKSKLKN